MLEINWAKYKTPNELVLSLRPLAKRLTRRFVRRFRAHSLDLESEADLALCEAVYRIWINHEKGVGYLIKYIQGKLLTYVYRKMHIIPCSGEELFSGDRDVKFPRVFSIVNQSVHNVNSGHRGRDFSMGIPISLVSNSLAPEFQDRIDQGDHPLSEEELEETIERICENPLDKEILSLYIERTPINTIGELLSKTPQCIIQHIHDCRIRYKRLFSVKLFKKRVLRGKVKREKINFAKFIPSSPFGEQMKKVIDAHPGINGKGIAKLLGTYPLKVYRTLRGAK